LDFDRIEKGAEQKMPKYGMVWRHGINDYASLALHRIFKITQN
jgi:hypothetical protein